VLGVVLALAAAVGYGVSDFAAGMASRKGEVLAVTFLATVCSLVVSAIALPWMSGHTPSVAALAWGAGGGLGGLGGALCLYAGFRQAEFSVAGPLSAVSSAGLSVIAGVALGERPSALSLTGIVVALPAIVLVSIAVTPARKGEPTAATPAGAGVAEAAPAGADLPGAASANAGVAEAAAVDAEFADVGSADVEPADAALADVRPADASAAGTGAVSVRPCDAEFADVGSADVGSADASAGSAGLDDVRLAGASTANVRSVDAEFAGAGSAGVEPADAGAAGAALAGVRPAGANPAGGPSGQAGQHGRGGRLAGVGLGLAAGVGFALLFVGLNRAGSAAGVWPVIAGQVMEAIVMAGVVAGTGGWARARLRGAVALAVLTGVSGGAATIFYFVATHKGFLAIAAVLTSLYPAGTIGLARVFASERLSAARLAGLVLAGLSVTLIALGGTG
jgi:drug/metabolite transporter (DMT)-like permease